MRTAIVLTLILLVLGTPVVVVTLLVDDWRRDLSTNVAATAPGASDPLLRPLVLDLPVENAAEMVETAAARLRGWKLLERVSRPDGAELRYERTTRWLRFKDDVVVRVRDVGSASEVTAVSASRIGAADLGQNPRNLKELLSSLHAAQRLIDHDRASASDAR